MSITQTKEAEAALDANPSQLIDRVARPVFYYEVMTKSYWMEDARQNWVPINESSLRRHLQARGYSSKKKDGDTVSDVDGVINKIQLNFNVVYAGPLAGYQKGVHEVGAGRKILVTEAPKLIQPCAGEYPVLKGILERMLGPEQLPYLKGWLKVAYESLRDGKRRPGQMLVLAGKKDCGKSLLQNLITEILGGRMAKPYRYMTGGTDFNRDLFGAEHLMIEDDIASTDIRARRNFGARIKEFTVNERNSCHGKNREAITLAPFWRTTVSVNDETENLQILPPMEESLKDKIILLQVASHPMPMPTFTDEERHEFWSKLVSELPAFLADLVAFQIPDALRCRRFGVKYFHHPDLLASLEETTPETRLLALIDMAFEDQLLEPAGFTGSAEQLQRVLVENMYNTEARNLLHWPGALGTYLGRLQLKHPERVSRAQRTSAARPWVIKPPAVHKAP